ncbi:ComE operon protein 2 [Bacillus lacus]|uniref:ComE operon protein 2 n=1 Tax=Metabacillus lacus TaxID=1983721 RepID=A0A7X2LYW6_9BACI|nr:ComE operon protein 2 [Metabacillus lacus]MRX71332.1 ComE operon protein 2 [Metabacillus lacus]
MERISWNQYFLAQSHLLALRSTCTRLAVGATIVRDKRIIAGGYNGSIAGGVHCTDDGCYVIDNHCVRTIHAEMNALLQCAKFGVPTAGAEIYVTHFPCLQCCKAIIQAGISSVYYAMPYKNHPYAEELFKQSGVEVKHIDFNGTHSDAKNEQRAALVKELLGRLADGSEMETELDELYERAQRLFPESIEN